MMQVNYCRQFNEMIRSGFNLFFTNNVCDGLEKRVVASKSNNLKML